MNPQLQAILHNLFTRVKALEDAVQAKTLTEDTECQYCKQGCIRCDARKLLTDEEITEVIKKIASNNEYVYSLYEDFEGIEFSRIGIFEFARAIMERASEK